MREIKFRGIRKDNGKFVYGSYHFCTDRCEMMTSNYGSGYTKKFVDIDCHWIFEHNSPDHSGWDVKDTFRAYTVNAATIGQFTGLQDKNGKDIYESDIVKWSPWGTGGIRVGDCDKKTNLVEWSNKKGCWFIQHEIWSLGIYSDVEIIGNIYETPDLL